MDFTHRSTTRTLVTALGSEDLELASIQLVVNSLVRVWLTLELILEVVKSNRQPIFGGD